MLNYLKFNAFLRTIYDYEDYLISFTAVDWLFLMLAAVRRFLLIHQRTGNGQQCRKTFDRKVASTSRIA
jgi:hypothetical protein